MTRLLFVMNTPTMGGAERHKFDLAGALGPNGFESTIFAMKAGQLKPKGLALRQPDRPRRLPTRIADLSGAIRDVRPHVIVAVNERPVLAAFGARFLARSRTPIVGISHSTVLRNRREEAMQVAYTPLFNRIESVVFISDNQRTYWEARGFEPRQRVVILNGIDIERFSPQARAQYRDATRAGLGIRDDEFVMGLCAVMRPEKNHLDLVETVHALRANGQKARLVFVGDGPMRAAIEAKVDELGMADAVTLAGMHDDVRPFVAAFDVGVLCSSSIETLSLAALETMAMGIPMVMSDLGGASEIIDGRNGRLFPVGDLAALRLGISAFMDPKTRAEAGRLARATVEEKFDRGRMIAAYADHFRHLASRGPVRELS